MLLSKLLSASPDCTLTFPRKTNPPGPVIPQITPRRSHQNRVKSQLLAFLEKLVQRPGLQQQEEAQFCWELRSQTLAAPAELRGSPVGVGEDLKTIIVLYFSSLITKQSCPLPLATIFSSCSHGCRRGKAVLLPLCLISFSSEAFSFLHGLLGEKRTFSKRLFCSGVFVIIGNSSWTKSSQA